MAEAPVDLGRAQWLPARLTPILSPRLQGIALMTAIIFPATLVLFGSRQGLGLSPDSVGYIAAARSFSESGTLLTIGGERMTIWPPGFPILLGSLLRLGLSLNAVVIGLNVICVMLTVALSYALALESLASRGLATLSAIAISVSPSTGRVFRMLWTEPPFVVLTLLALVILVRACRRARISWWEILIVGAAVGLATSMRFVGLTLIPTVVIGTFIASRRTLGRLRAAAAATVAGGIASIGLCVVVLRNLGLGSAALGNRSPSDISLPRVLFQSSQTVGSYLIPQSWSIIGVVVGVTLAFLMSYGLWRAVVDGHGGLISIAVFIGTYWAMLWYSQLATRIDPINERLTAPIFTPMVILVIYGVREWQQVAWRSSQGLHISSKVRSYLRGLVALLSAALLLGAIAQSLVDAWQDARLGMGYNSIASQTSPLALSLVDLPAEAGIASNDVAKAYWVSGRSPVIQMPRDGHYWSVADTARDMEVMKMLIASGRIDYLAVFDEYQLLNPGTSARAGFRMRLLASFEDGALYEVTPVK